MAKMHAAEIERTNATRVVRGVTTRGHVPQSDNCRHGDNDLHPRIVADQGLRFHPRPTALRPRSPTPFFNRAQTIVDPQSVPSVWGPTSTIPENVGKRHAGTTQKSDAGRTIKGDSSIPQATFYAATGTAREDAPAAPTAIATSARAVETETMEPRSVLELRRTKPLTPYNATAWRSLLHASGLLDEYSDIPNGLAYGFDVGIRQLHTTVAPPNGPSLCTYADAYNDIVRTEFERGRYIGPFSREEVITLIGPFQSSPLSLVPKPGKPGKFRAVHNFSYP